MLGVPPPAAGPGPRLGTVTNGTAHPRAYPGGRRPHWGGDRRNRRPRDTMTQLPLPPGLSTAEAAARLRRDGPNVVPSARSASVLRELASQFTHLLAILLWVAAGFALLAGMPQLAVAIVVIVLLNGGFAFWQEFRADRSAQELQQLIPRRCRVVRDGAELEVPAADLVVDDLVVLQPGDRVAADLVVVRADGLRLDESRRARARPWSTMRATPSWPAASCCRVRRPPWRRPRVGPPPWPASRR